MENGYKPSTWGLRSISSRKSFEGLDGICVVVVDVEAVNSLRRNRADIRKSPHMGFF